MGNTHASAMRTFARPYTLRSASTTPPCACGSIAHEHEGWYLVPIAFASHLSQSSLDCTALRGGDLVADGRTQRGRVTDLARELKALAEEDGVGAVREVLRVKGSSDTM